jgi:hypothetical protein
MEATGRTSGGGLATLLHRDVHVPGPGIWLQMSISTEFWKKNATVGTSKSKHHLFSFFPEMKCIC